MSVSPLKENSISKMEISDIKSHWSLITNSSNHRCEYSVSPPNLSWSTHTSIPVRQFQMKSKQCPGRPALPVEHLQSNVQSIYPKDPQIMPYLLATLKCSHVLMSWTCAEFFRLIIV